MNWTPNKWIAAVLGFLFQPLGMLYVIRVKWALVYFFGGTFISLSEFYGQHKLNLPWLEYFSFAWLLMFVCAIHAYRIARHWAPVAIRPWYSHWYGLIAIPTTVKFSLLRKWTTPFFSEFYSIFISPLSNYYFISDLV